VQRFIQIRFAVPDSPPGQNLDVRKCSTFFLPLVWPSCGNSGTSQARYTSSCSLGEDACIQFENEVILSKRCEQSNHMHHFAPGALPGLPHTFGRQTKPDAPSVAGCWPCGLPDPPSSSCRSPKDLFSCVACPQVPRCQPWLSLKQTEQSRVLYHHYLQDSKNRPRQQHETQGHQTPGIVDWCRSFSMGMTWLESLQRPSPFASLPCRRQPDGYS
jgi:hypothetical protein